MTAVQGLADKFSF